MINIAIENHFPHTPVLLKEAVEGLAIKPNGIYIDGTFGRGSHSRYILSQLSKDGRLLAFDQDLEAGREAQAIQDVRFSFEHTQFSAMAEVCQRLNLNGKIDGILLDLGVSSPQLDDPERGFSFTKDGPLDMRMDTTRGQSASQWLTDVSSEDLAWVLKTFGEERFARRIANNIVNYNKNAIGNGQPPLTRTSQLAQLIDNSIPFKEKHKHPATRTFQAIRIFINAELDELEQALQSALTILAPKGRLAVISFHSLEDRMVKRFMRRSSQGEIIPKGLPVREDQINNDKKLTLISRAIMPSLQEITSNPRARSAVLRLAERN